MQLLWIVYINELLMGHTKIHFISERGLIGAQISTGLCRVLSIVCQQISSINAHFCKLRFYVNLGQSWFCWYSSWIFNYLCYQCLLSLSCEFESRGVPDTTFCDKVCQWLAVGWWFSPGNSGFLNQYNWLPRYNWNIVESTTIIPNPTLMGYNWKSK